MCPGRVAPEAISERADTTESWVQSQDSLCNFCGGLNNSGTDFPRVLHFALYCAIPPVFLRTRKQTGETWEPPKK